MPQKRSKNYCYVQIVLGIKHIHFLSLTGVGIDVFDHDSIINHMKKLLNNCYVVQVYANHVD